LLLLFVLLPVVVGSAEVLRAGTQSGAGNAKLKSDVPDSLMQRYVHGSLLAMKGDYWSAIDVFRKASALRPDEGAFHYSISKAFYNLSVLDSARVHGETALRLDPANMQYARYLARLAHEMRDYDRAAALYGEAVKAAPNHINLQNSQALEYLSADRSTQALDVFRTLLKRDPMNESALSQTLMLEIKLNLFQDAIVTLKQLAAASGNNQRLQMTLGELYEKSGQSEMAVDTFRKLIAADRHYVPAWVALLGHFILSAETQDFDRQQILFQDVFRDDPMAVIETVKLFLIRSESDTLYVSPARRMLDGLVAHHPRDSRVYVLRGVYEMRQHNGVQAVSNFSKAIQLNVRNVDAWDALVMAHLEMKQSRKAFEAIATARRRLPADAFRLKIIEGYLLLHTGSPGKAAALLAPAVRLKAAVRNEEQLVQANLTLAMAYDELGNKKRSRQAYARVLELDPHNTLAMNNLAFQLAQDGIMLQHALTLARNAALLEPANGVFLDTLGWVYFRLGNYSVAREMIEKAVATGASEAEIYQHLGMVYEKLGEHEKSNKMFEKAKAVKGK
jgi:tetratricopeptide (TPR) repeat protein